MNRTIKLPKTLFRTGTSELGEDGQIRLSISSDTPYLRYDWFEGKEFYEVLDHAAGGMDKSRLKQGAALLYNHDRNIQLGTITNPKCEDGKCFVDAKLSKAPDVESYRIRIDEGILKDTSVGYQIDDEGEVIGKKDGKPVIKFKWFPHEASMVTIPADISVGVGRELQRALEKDAEMKEITVRVDNAEDSNKQRMADNPPPSPTPEPVPPPQKIDVSKERNEAVTTERKRVGDIQELSRHFAEKGLAGRKINTAEVAEKAIKDGKTLREFQDEVVRGEFKEIAPLVTPSDMTENLGLSQKDKARFSLLAACRSIAKRGQLEGFEKEVSDAAAKRVGITNPDVKAIYLPPDINEYDPRLGGFSERGFQDYARSVNATTGTSGGATIATQVGPMIDLLRNQTILDKAGVTTLAGLRGDLSMPVQTGAAVAYWVGEEECVTDSAPTFAQKGLTPHRLSASIPFTSQFLAQSSLNAEQFLRNELMTVAGLAIDKAGLEGTGTGGEPLGVRYTPNVGADITFSGSAEWADIVGFETYITTANANIGSIAFIVSSATRGKWKTILRVTAGASGDFLIQDNAANGYPVYATNQLSDNIVYFGVWSQLIHAMWDTQEIIVDPYALKKCGGIEITYNSFHDFLVRQPKAFEVSTDSGAA